MTMLEHVVLFRCPPLSDDEEQRFVTEGAAFAGIDGVLTSVAGRLTRAVPDAYTHALIMRVRDRDAFDRYVADPRHKAFVDWIVPRSEVAIYDVESEAAR